MVVMGEVNNIALQHNERNKNSLRGISLTLVPFPAAPVHCSPHWIEAQNDKLTMPRDYVPIWFESSDDPKHAKRLDPSAKTEHYMYAEAVWELMRRTLNQRRRTLEHLRKWGEVVSESKRAGNAYIMNQTRWENVLTQQDRPSLDH
jgi:hypothetical protein